MGFPHDLAGKESACNTEDLGSIPGLGRSPGEENGNPLQYSYLENPMDRRAWWAAVHGVAKSRTRLKRLSSRVPNRIIQLITKAQSAPWWLNYQMQEVGEFVNAGSGIYPHIERLSMKIIHYLQFLDEKM